MTETGNIERRAVAEVRATGRKLQGYAVRYGVETRIGNIVEKVAKGAFDASLASVRDVLALVDHDPAMLLARTRSGTLHLRSDDDGLGFTIDLPNTGLANDVLALAERGDIGGMSFGFQVARDGERWQGNVRELRAVTLHEVSVIHSWPAYEGTSVEARRRLPARLALARRFLETV